MPSHNSGAGLSDGARETAGEIRREGSGAPSFSRRIIRAVLVAPLLVFAPSLAAQQQDMSLFRALDFERQGRYEESAAAFRQVLAREPANVQAMAGAERVYVQLGRRDSIAAMVQRALVADPQNNVARQIDVRNARAMGGEPLAAEAIARWLAVAPRSESPYREMVRILLAANRTEDAREAVQAARERIGPQALRTELAQIEAAAGNWARAAQEWRLAISEQPDLATVAVFNLRNVPEQRRDPIVRVLTDDTSSVGRRLAAELMVGWNQAEQAWALLQTALPRDADERRSALQRFAERARALDGPGPKRAAARALELLAASSPPLEATRFRIESARAWAEAGDGAAARRVLKAMADDPAAPGDAGSAAAASLVELYAREGNAPEAARSLAQARQRLPGSEAARLAIVVARAWLAQGRLEQAEAQIAADSSLAADEIRGWVALYRGDLRAARTLLRAGAAPRTGDPRPIVDRVAILELLAAVRGDSSRPLGGALQTLARGDSATAVRQLTEIAGSVPHGQPELLAVAARLSATRSPAESEALWNEVARRFPRSAPAPAAHLALARLMASRGDVAGAARRLEQLILDYPESALIPEARRELDRVRGAIPRS